MPPDLDYWDSQPFRPSRKTSRWKCAFRIGCRQHIRCTPPPSPGLTPINKASNGTIKIAIYPAQQLGKAFDHYNMARDGIVDISHVNPGYEPGRFPIVAAVELPFIFSNSKEGSAALDSWYRRYAATAR